MGIFKVLQIDESTTFLGFLQRAIVRSLAVAPGAKLTNISRVHS